MNNIIEKLKSELPLLNIGQPDIKNFPADLIESAVPTEVHDYIFELIARSCFVYYGNRTGEQGVQIQNNKDRLFELRANIVKLYPKGRFTFKFYHLLILVKVNSKKEWEPDRIKFRVINHLNPADQEAAAA